MMKVKFWGVRGSLPIPGPDTVKYGGNTACIELQAGAGLFIIDAGSGIRELGDSLMSRDLPRPLRLEIFLTHTHLDHLVGFPFFAPIYVPGTELTIHGPVTYEENYLEDVVNGQFTYRYFPVRWAELAARIEFAHLKEERRELAGGTVVTTKYLNHPVLSLGYRFAWQGKVFCTVYDTEPFQNPFITDPDNPGYDAEMAREGQDAARLQNERLEEFFAGADVLVHDAQYTEEEYGSCRRGWGHTSCERAIAAARRGGVGKLVLFHHDPQRTDAQLDELAARFASVPGERPEVVFAREGMEITL